MCGRFEFKADPEYLEKIYQKGKRKLNPEYDLNIVLKHENIAPTDKILTIILRNDEYILNVVKWGFKFSDDSPLIFNSRIETIRDNIFWKTLFTNSKCLIPMTAFYEWTKTGTKKIPQRIFLPDENVFYVPAIYSKDNVSVSASLITTAPNKFMKNIHNRMPVLLQLEEGIEYLHNDFDTNLELCQPFNDNLKMAIEPAVISNLPV